MTAIKSKEIFRMEKIDRLLAEALEPDPEWDDDWECNAPAQYSREGMWERDSDLKVHPIRFTRVPCAMLALIDAMAETEAEWWFWCAHGKVGFTLSEVSVEWDRQAKTLPYCVALAALKALEIEKPVEKP